MSRPVSVSEALRTGKIKKISGRHILAAKKQILEKTVLKEGVIKFKIV